MAAAVHGAAAAAAETATTRALGVRGRTVRVAAVVAGAMADRRISKKFCAVARTS